MSRLGRCALAGVVLLIASGPAGAFQPRDSRETDAVNVRILQSEMMVAAFTCDMRQNYNLMVTKFEDELVAHGRVLRQMFRRDHGRSAQKALDGFVTQLANDASIRSTQARQEFCVNADQVFTSVLTGQESLAETGLRTVEGVVIQQEGR